MSNLNLNIDVGNGNAQKGSFPSASSTKKNVFIFDKNKCVGCHACIVACENENGFDSKEFWRNVRNSNPSHIPDLPLFYLSIACNHCNDAPCVSSCPTLSFHVDDKTGAILHNPDSCIGCKYCSWTCPYDAPKYNHKTGIIEKCNFCNHRIEEGLKPACANLCPTGALDFSFEEPMTESDLHSSPITKKVGPSIKIIELRNPSPPKTDRLLFADQKDVDSESSSAKKLSGLKEWPLVIFTIISAILMGTYLSKDHYSIAEIRWVLMGLSLLATLFSVMHLGKKTRAWRAISNIENSWLSREILFFVFFSTSLFLDLFLWEIPDLVPILNGFLLLASIEMLYKPLTGSWKLKVHSAQTPLIALSLWFFLSGYNTAFLILITLRLSLYILRKVLSTKKSGYISFVRIVSAVLASGIIIFSSPIWLGIVFFLAGELIDRIEFYDELEIRNEAFL